MDIFTYKITNKIIFTVDNLGVFAPHIGDIVCSHVEEEVLNDMYDNLFYVIFLDIKETNKKIDLE